MCAFLSFDKKDHFSRSPVKFPFQIIQLLHDTASRLPIRCAVHLVFMFVDGGGAAFSARFFLKFKSTTGRCRRALNVGLKK